MLLNILMAAAAVAGAPQTQAALNDQSSRDFAQADAALNAQYRTAMADMLKLDRLDAPDARSGPSYQAALRNAQRAWIAFRDAECLAEGYEFRGGSAEAMAAAQCATILTRERTRQLRTALPK